MGLTPFLQLLLTQSAWGMCITGGNADDSGSGPKETAGISGVNQCTGSLCLSNNFYEVVSLKRYIKQIKGRHLILKQPIPTFVYFSSSWSYISHLKDYGLVILTFITKKAWILCMRPFIQIASPVSPSFICLTKSCLYFKILLKWSLFCPNIIHKGYKTTLFFEFHFLMRCWSHDFICMLVHNRGITRMETGVGRGSHRERRTLTLLKSTAAIWSHTDITQWCHKHRNSQHWHSIYPGLESSSINILHVFISLHFSTVKHVLLSILQGTRRKSLWETQTVLLTKNHNL